MESGSQDVIAVSPLRASQLLGLSRTTLYLAMATGQLKSFRVGRARRIALEEIRRFVSAKAQEEAEAVTAR